MTSDELYKLAASAGYRLGAGGIPCSGRLPCPVCGNVGNTDVIFDNHARALRKRAVVTCLCGQFATPPIPVVRGRDTEARLTEAWNSAVNQYRSCI